jgi:hypothetical protein
LHSASEPASSTSRAPFSKMWSDRVMVAPDSCGCECAQRRAGPEGVAAAGAAEGRTEGAEQGSSMHVARKACHGTQEGLS